ncbi:uncharacterized protein LOC119778313 [Cyprinodon tularosa]|uniref:uncharacterized protein LOC119778313 n=1 Tax=Cyprinodon tularosa TaxID=77115 RepID=UPI0018E1E1C4|nr:uncharacterized protein LOC119778313 [Cyprinodon tularosa]
MVPVLWSFMVLLAGSVAQMTWYRSTSSCAVTGSTLTLPCTFTPKRSFTEGNREVPLKIVRVGWCKEHEICQGMRPSVYDSRSPNNEPRYRYLGDLEGNCTLQISDAGKQDNETFRFRMEADNTAGHFTNTTGVKITVLDAVKMKISSSSNTSEFSSGQTVSLRCSASECTFTHLEVTWLKDGRVLPENGSTLHLSALTAKDSGNYTCGLKKNIRPTRSDPFRLQVEVEDGASALPLVAGVLFGVLLLMITIILVIFIIKRKRTELEAPNTLRGETETKNEELYSSIVLHHQDAAGQGQEAGHEGEEVRYASVQFRPLREDRKAEKEADQTIYSSVATRS